MASGKIKGITVEIGGNTTKLGKAIDDVDKKSRSLQGELKQVEKLLKMDPGNTELLAQKQELLTEAVSETADKLDILKKAEKQVQEQFKQGKVSTDQVRALQREIVSTTQRMRSYEDALNNSGEETEELADKTDKAENEVGGFGETLTNVAKGGLAVVAAGCTALIGALTASAEATREYRTEMGKLESAFTSAGFTAHSANRAYEELYSIIGETDQSVEAAQQIALLAESEKDVSKWSKLAAGVVAKFGDALQPESFFEAANETVKLGEATGAYTQMLEQGGLNVENFNAALSECNTEAEKLEYIYTTAKAVLGDAGYAYKEINAEVIRANKANNEWMQSMADVGESIEPILTDVKMLGASLLSEFVPGVQSVADAFRGILNGDEGAADELGSALSGIFTGLIDKVVDALPAIAETALSLISTLATSLLAQVPRLLSIGGEIVFNLANGIASNLPQMAQSAMDMITGFVGKFQEFFPILIQRGREILTNLGTGIRESLPGLISQALDALMGFATTLYDNAPTLIQTGFDLLSNLVQGILDSIPTLLAKGPEIVSKFANIINDNFPTILKKGVELIFQIIKGIISAIPDLIKNAPKIITAIVDVWEAFNWLDLGRKAITLLKDGVLKMVSAVTSAGTTIKNGITNVIKDLPNKLLQIGKNAIRDLGGSIRNGLSTIKSAASSIFNGVINSFTSLPSKLLGIGKDLVRGLWNGISDMTGWIVGKIQGFGDSVLSGIKDFFGIKSPSRVFRDEVGAMLTAGLAEGIEDNANDPINAIDALSENMLNEADAINGLTFNRKLTTTFVTPGNTPSIDNNTALLRKLDGIYERLNRLQIVLDTGTLVGETIERIDAGLATRQLLSARGV